MLTRAAAALGSLACSFVALGNPALSAENDLSLTFHAVVDESISNIYGNISKKDIIVVGDEVIIDKPINSSGGNVIIVSDRLIIAAPIDTRARPVGSGPYWIGALGQESTLPALLQHADSNVRNAFSVYYTWHEYYDSKDKRYKFRSGSIDDLATGRLALDSMPYGRVPGGSASLPPRDGSPLDGPDAPNDYNKVVFKSGDIIVFARSIEFCGTCVRTRFDEPPATGGDPLDRERVRFLNAAGLKGGKGGLGGVFPCVYNAPPQRAGNQVVQVPCDEVLGRPGGLSGSPSAGGDAGNISIYIVNNPDFAEQQKEFQTRLENCERHNCKGEFPATFGQSIAALTNVEGGQPSQTSRLRTPSYRDLQSGQRGAFVPERPIEDLEALRGKTGSLQIRQLTADEALGQIAVTLSSFDDNPKYDERLLIQSLVDRRGLSTLEARDLLAEFLLTLLVKRQVALLDRLPNALSQDSSEIVSVDLLTDLQCEGRSVPGLIALEFELVRRICEFRSYPGGTGALRSYLYRTGGLLRPTAIVSSPDLQTERAIAELTRIGEAVREVSDGIRDFETMFYHFMTDMERRRYEVRLSELRDAIAKATAALEARNDDDVFKRLIASGKGAQANVTAALAGFTSGDYFAMATGVYEGGRAVVEFFAIMNGDDLTEQQRNSLASMQAELLSMEIAFSAFQQEVAHKKEELLERQFSGLSDLLRARNSLATSRTSLVLDFESNLRAALLSYVSDPFRQTDGLLSHARTIRDLVEHFPNQALNTLPLDTVRDCGAPRLLSSIRADAPIECGLLRAEDTTYALVSTAGSRLRDFPLLVVAAGSGTFAVPFGWLFTPDEVRKVTTGAAVRGWSPADSQLTLP